ncbi:Protein TIC 214 [Linum perenne]
MTLGKSYIIMGIYYGFPIILSMGPSHLRLLQTRGLAQGKKGIQETKAARLGFILGQLIIFVSVYNTPLAQPLGRAPYNDFDSYTLFVWGFLFEQSHGVGLSSNLSSKTQECLLVLADSPTKCNSSLSQSGLLSKRRLATGTESFDLSMQE